MFVRFWKVKDGTSESFAREPILLHQRDRELEKLIPREPENVTDIHEIE